jgi:hypothetical protein
MIKDWFITSTSNFSTCCQYNVSCAYRAIPYKTRIKPFIPNITSKMLLVNCSANMCNTFRWHWHGIPTSLLVRGQQLNSDPMHTSKVALYNNVASRHLKRWLRWWAINLKATPMRMGNSFHSIAPQGWQQSKGTLNRQRKSGESMITTVGKDTPFISALALLSPCSLRSSGRP